MEFGVLGPVEVRVDGRPVHAGHARQRAVLAVLLLDAGRAVPLDVLIDRVWGEEPPRSVRNVVYGYVSRLKTLIAGAQDPEVTLSRRPGGYELQTGPDQVDVCRFRGLIADAATAARDDERAGVLLGEAAELWRGTALAGLDSPWLNGQRARLELEQVAAAGDLRDIRLRRGEHAALAGELTAQAAVSPADERLIGQLMLALYRSGRQAEALSWFEQTRQHLAGELGTDPGPELRALHMHILRADPVLNLPPTVTGRRDGALAPRELRTDVPAFTGRAAEGAHLDRILTDPAAVPGQLAESGAGNGGVLAVISDHGRFRIPAQRPGQLDAANGTGGPAEAVMIPAITQPDPAGGTAPPPGDSQALEAASPALAVSAPASGAPGRAGAEAGQALSAAQRPNRRVFVGRENELAILAAAAAAASRGEPRVVLVEGEEGIGKSSLLAQFALEQPHAALLRASGDEAEVFLPYGVTSQLVSGAVGNGISPQGLLASALSGAVDPLAIGAELRIWLGRIGRDREMVLVVIDDLQWADTPSARALLFAVRHIQADRVLIVASARAGELSSLGEGWRRFLAGDHRAERIRLGGLGPEDMVALAQALGAGRLSRRAAGRLLAETGGNSLYCRAVLEEPGASERLGGPLPVPRSLAELMLSRTDGLSPAAHELVAAAAVLGQRCRLDVAVQLADLRDPLPALEQTARAGILAEELGTAGCEVGFTHLLVQRAIYGNLSLARRRELHQRAAGLVDQQRALGHRVAAADGPDDALADQLEAASREALGLGRTAQAADLLAQAATISSDPAAADHRLLEALEILVIFGEVAAADALAAQVGTGRPSARRSCMLGTLDYRAGRAAAAEARLVEAWQRYDLDRDSPAGCAAALWLAVLCLTAGRLREAIEWSERAASVAAAPVAVRHAALGVSAITMCFEGRGPEGLTRLAFLPATSAEVPREETNTLVLRGMARGAAEDLAGAIADLSTAAARLRGGQPLTTASICLAQLASAEFRIGSWDDAMGHAELAVSLAYDAGRVLDLANAHSIAAVVPAVRGDWAAASAHVQLATQAAQAVGDAAAIGMASIAQEYLAMAQGDLDGVVLAAAATRATGRKEFFSLSESYDWRWMEIGAFIGLGQLGQAEQVLAAMEADLSTVGPPSARVAAARLRTDLATAAGRATEAAAACDIAWQHARCVQAPLSLARLEISDARRLRAAGQPGAAVARLTSARQRLAKLGAEPDLQVCDRELAMASARQPEPALPGLSPAEHAVARLVGSGHTNRQAAAELYISVKTIEFHLSSIFTKLGIRSRKELISRYHSYTVQPGEVPGGSRARP
jgi:DNA-binding SARP family transcriptional activator/DNA-binding CsgD family transcriptional regulator/tetratricopeptide (TPR) repeat protein